MLPFIGPPILRRPFRWTSRNSEQRKRAEELHDAQAQGRVRLLGEDSLYARIIGLSPARGVRACEAGRDWCGPRPDERGYGPLAHRLFPNLGKNGGSISNAWTRRDGRRSDRFGMPFLSAAVGLFGGTENGQGRLARKGPRRCAGRTPADADGRTLEPARHPAACGYALPDEIQMVSSL